MDKVKNLVLVVDDEPVVRQLVRRILSREYDVVEAGDGAQAVDVAKAKKPSIVLMDMMMPEMDGLSACYAIRQDETTREIPVVMLTAVTHELNRRLSESVMGASAYITKPFEASELLSTVHEVLERAKGSLDQKNSAVTPA